MNLGRSEQKTVMAVVLAAVIITGSMLFYSILTLPPREEFPTISVLNQDRLAVGLIQTNNASQFHFFVMIQNYLGHTGYFLVNVWRGQIIGDTNPPLNSCVHWGNFSRIIMNDEEHVSRVNDTIYISQPNERYIYYCVLHMYNSNTGEFEQVLNALGDSVMVWMQVNVTA